jgi:hypothetical protein
MTMKPNPILEEVWRIKDELAREAGDDVHRMCENTRKWAAEHPHTGPIVRDADALRRYYEQLEAEALVLREEPPKPGQ